MPFKLHNYKVHASYLDCVMNATAWKVKDRCYGVKYRGKNTANFNSFGKMYPIKGL